MTAATYGPISSHFFLLQFSSEHKMGFLSFAFHLPPLIHFYLFTSLIKVLCEEINVGEAVLRTIASGIRPHYAAEDLVNRKVCVLANLKDRNLAGFKSQVRVSKNPFLCAIAFCLA